MEEVLKRIQDYALEEIMGERFGAYAKEIIQDRAIPDVRDGLKPVQRRILYAMYRANNTHEHGYIKCAATVGDVLGKYHPHGDSSVYDAMVRMSQWWKQNAILIDIHGNNGSMDGDGPAAYRYTEARLAKISNELLRDLDKETVEWAPNFDDRFLEPTVLPAKFPNLLVNGANGISAGYATNIPPHNLGEICDATIKRIDSPNCRLDTILDIVKGPDFPTGGIVEGKKGIIDAFTTGRGKVVVRAKTRFVKEIPTTDPGYLTTTVPTLPTIDNLATKMFTTESNGVIYTGDQMTFTVNDDAAYDWKWWNGANKSWDSVVKGDYTRTWTPKWGDVSDYELVLGKKSDGTYTYTSGSTSGTFTINGNVLTFDKEITILTASNDYRKVELTGKEWTVLECESGDHLTIGIPASKDEKGYVNSYLVANLNFKAISSASGPTTVNVDNSTINKHLWIENKCLRLGFWHYGSDGSGIFNDVSKVKLKKGQTITVKFKITSGITWTGTPKCALIDNNIKTTWEQGCFDLSDAVTVNTSGETTVTLTNNTESTQTFTATCLDLSIQLDGYGTIDAGKTADGKDDFSGIKMEVTSCTIQ